MKRLLLIALLAAPLAVFGDDALRNCSIKSHMITPKSDLKAMAKVSEGTAKSAALAHAGPGASIVKGGLESDDGCLVYSYHVKKAGVEGQTEVFVDAGNGIVLAEEKEGAIRTALEKPIDKTKELAKRAKDEVTGK
jgi:hypothetical protein